MPVLVSNENFRDILFEVNANQMYSLSGVAMVFCASFGRQIVQGTGHGGQSGISYCEI